MKRWTFFRESSYLNCGGILLCWSEASSPYSYVVQTFDKIKVLNDRSGKPNDIHNTDESKCLRFDNIKLWESFTRSKITSKILLCTSIVVSWLSPAGDIRLALFIVQWWEKILPSYRAIFMCNLQLGTTFWSAFAYDIVSTSDIIYNSQSRLHFV